MCGIISAKNLIDDKPVNNLVKFLYFNQKSRGIDGFGFIGLNKQRLDTYRALDEPGFLEFLDRYQYDELILHHRLPTSTENTLNTTHPFVIAYQAKKYYFIHNGVITNSQKLKARHELQGISYASQQKDKSFNDSETLAWEFVLWLNNKQKSIQAQGSAAFICLETDKMTNKALRLYFSRNSGSPLRAYLDNTLLVLTSEGNWGGEVKTNRLYYFDYQTKQIIKGKKLNIEPGYTSSYYWCDSLNWETEPLEWELFGLQAEIKDLEQEQGYLISSGELLRAQELEDELDELRAEVKDLERVLKQAQLPF